MTQVPFTCDIAFRPSQVLASAATVDLSTVDGNQVSISGTNAISSFGSGINLFRVVKYLAATPLVNSSALKLMLNQNRTTVANDICVYVSGGAGNWTEVAAPLPPQAQFGLLSSQFFGSSQTITIPANVSKAKVRMYGATGGSGGVAAGKASAGSGAGGYLEKFLTGLVPGNTLVFTQGAAGAAGTSAPTAGGNGGTTTLVSGTQTISTLTCNGSNGTPANSNNVSTPNPPLGGTATGGDINIPGQSGVNDGASGGIAEAGTGGRNFFSIGADGVVSAGVLAGNAGNPGGLIIDWFT